MTTTNENPAERALNSRINVTPLADVMLVLLIIFMVITPLLRPGVHVDVPESSFSSEHPDGDETLVLSLRGDGGIFLNRDEITDEELFPRLSSAFNGGADRLLFLKADAALDYRRVLEMMNRCRGAGVEQIALITKELIPPSP